MTLSNVAVGNALGFEVSATEGAARAGVIQTRRGAIETPVFMPVGTLATVKGVRFEDLESEELDARIILANTYHLWLRPGAEVVRACGGVHKFGTWRRAMLTDSGGFQVFSLGDLRKITEEGVRFRSHIDGSPRFLSPEISMEVQAALGSDIVMVFDECLPGESDREATKRSMEMTLRWAQRSKNKFDELQASNADAGFSEHENLNGRQALFGIVQGATHEDLRCESLEKTVDIGFDGYALGGLSVGEEKQVMYEITEKIAPLMPKDKPRYMMGVGTPEDLIEGVARGIDMFDCVLPTRNARTGQALTSRGKLNIRNARFVTDTAPLDETCLCSVCRRYSRAYLRHLHLTGEMLAAMLLSHHNLFFFLDTMKRVRQAIRLHSFAGFRRDFLDLYRSGIE